MEKPLLLLCLPIYLLLKLFINRFLECVCVAHNIADTKILIGTISCAGGDGRGGSFQRELLIYRLEQFRFREYSVKALLFRNFYLLSSLLCWCDFTFCLSEYDREISCERDT